MRSFCALIVSLFVAALFLQGCVNTDSSSSGIESSSDANQTVPDDSNTSDSNTSDSNQTDPIDDDYDQYEPNEDQANSDFDTRGAQLDPNACNSLADMYGSPLIDSSLDPDRERDAAFGVEIGSRLPNSPQIDLTRVALYYPVDLGEADALNLSGTSTTIATSLYVFSYDSSWVGSTNRTFYVRTPRLEENNGYLGCFKYEIVSTDPNQIEAQKVYRLR